MNLKNRTSCLFKIVLFIIFSIFVAEIIVLPKIEHDMLKEAGRQELVTVQQLCGAVLEKNPDVEQDFILGLRQPTKSWQEKGEQILNQYGYDEEHLLADNTLYAAYMIAWRNWTGFFLITTFLLLATSLLYFYSIIRNSNREILLILEQYLSEDFSFAYGTERIPFTGTLMASTNSSDDTFLIADEVLQQLITETNPASAIYITVQPEKFESVKAQIDTLQQENTKFMFKSYDEELGIAKQLIRTIQYTIYGLLIVIGIIGYISLINTMITSILVRKKELGILQAIGLSDKQLRQMIHREGMFFTLGTLVLSLTIGNGLGYLLVRIIINTQILTISQYEYPITQTLVLIVAVVIGQIAITVFVNRYIHKQSLVERMRD